MTAFFLALAAAWLWFVLVTASESHMRAAILVPFLAVLYLLQHALKGMAMLVDKVMLVIVAAAFLVSEWVERKLGPVSKTE
jgi:hypothetical protein